MNTASPPAVVAEGLAFSYASGGGVQRADLTLGAGTMTAVEGPSGSGKSTLLALLGLILSPAAGSLHIDGAATHALPAAERDLLRRRSIGIVLQDLGLLPFLNAWENVAAAFGPRLARHRTAARDLLGDLGMGELVDSPVAELSGGQRQRVAVARAAVKQPVLVLADEPNVRARPGDRAFRTAVPAGLCGAGRRCPRRHARRGRHRGLRPASCAGRRRAVGRGRPGGAGSGT